MEARGRRELGLVAAGFLVYFGVRAVTQGSHAEAAENARALISLERSLGIYWEPSIQAAITGHHWLVTLMNWVYIWGHWPLIAAVAAWLFTRHPEAFRRTRTAFFVSGAIGMVFFILFPAAPPRLVDADFMDTVARYSHAYRALQPPSLVNRYAAFPSLHFGWDLLIGLALVTNARSLAGRALGVAMPVAMAVAVVLTANHWIIDVVAGALIALVGLLIATRLTPEAPAGSDSRPTNAAYTATRGPAGRSLRPTGPVPGRPARPRASRG
jgi:membrane-associated phospholipid phosphatase